VANLHVGKIIRIRNRFEGPPTIVVNTVGEGLRPHLHLCFTCRHFDPNNHDRHCQISQKMYEFSVENCVAFPVVRCAHMEPKEGIEVTDSTARKFNTE